jgi:hypothetical protein
MQHIQEVLKPEEKGGESKKKKGDGVLKLKEALFKLVPCLHASLTDDLIR